MTRETLETYDSSEPQEAAETPDRQPTPPIESRFLFVDIAAQRAKQLRRGAQPKLAWLQRDSAGGDLPRKPERIAMEEIRGGAIPYDLPALKSGATREAG